MASATGVWGIMSRRSVAFETIDRCLSVSNSAEDIRLTQEAIANPKLDWLAIVWLANKHLIVPALWTSLSRPQLCEYLPADLRNYLVLLHDRNAARNARIRLQCLRIGAVLARAGFRAALLKGAAWLFDESSPAASDRMLRDIDLVITPNDFEAALRTLAAAGYREASGIYVELEHFHCAPMICEGAEVCVEVHRDLDYRAEFLPSNEVIASSSEIAPGLLLPHSRHRIGHNVVHAQRLNGDFAGGVLSLRDTLDLARLVAANAPQIDWSALAQEARDRGYFHYLSGAIHAAHRCLHSPLPPPFVDHIWGRLHAWRCIQQRRWRICQFFEGIGRVTRALAWERDAYGLGIKARWSLQAQIFVNTRRAQRAIAALRNSVSSLVAAHVFRVTDELPFCELPFCQVNQSLDSNDGMEKLPRPPERLSGIDFAVTTVARIGDYIHELIASLPKDLRLHLVVGAPEFGVLETVPIQSQHRRCGSTSARVGAFLRMWDPSACRMELLARANGRKLSRSSQGAGDLGRRRDSCECLGRSSLSCNQTNRNLRARSIHFGLICSRRSRTQRT